MLETALGLTVEKLLQQKRSMHQALAAKMHEAAEAKARLRQTAEEAMRGLSYSLEDVEKEGAHEQPLTRLEVVAA